MESTKLEERCFRCNVVLSYILGISLDEKGNCLCKTCSDKMAKVKALLGGILNIGDSSFLCKYSEKWFPEKTKKLFWINGQLKAFWSVEDFGSRRANEMKDFFVPDFGEDVFFRENGKGWLAVVKGKEHLSNTYLFYRGDGDSKGWIFPGELCFEHI